MPADLLAAGPAPDPAADPAADPAPGGPLPVPAAVPGRPAAAAGGRRGGRRAAAGALLLAVLAGAVAHPAVDVSSLGGRLGGLLAAAVTLDPSAEPAAAAPAAPAPTAQELDARVRSASGAAQASLQLERAAARLDAGDTEAALDAFTVAVGALSVVRPEDGRAALDARALPLRARLVQAVQHEEPGQHG